MTAELIRQLTEALERRGTHVKGLLDDCEAKYAKAYHLGQIDMMQSVLGWLQDYAGQDEGTVITDDAGNVIEPEPAPPIFCECHRGSEPVVVDSPIEPGNEPIEIDPSPVAPSTKDKP